jgi:hypothetical protein
VDLGKFFQSNIDGRGQIVRLVWGVMLLAAAFFSQQYSLWLTGLLVLGALLGLFEAWRGWCVVRACGIRTKL